MKKLIFCTVLTACLAGCGGSGGTDLGLTAGDVQEQGNFITTTVEIEQRYLYTLNSGNGTVSGYVFPPAQEGEGHDHAHGRVLAQEDGHDHGEEEGGEHEEGPEPIELDPSPFDLDHTPIDLSVVADSFLVTLDDSGGIRVYVIDGVSGLFEFHSLLQTNIPNPRRLIVSDDAGVAVLGDRVVIYELNSSGNLSAPAFFDSTSTWVDLKLDGRVGAASTSEGAVGFSWRPGSTITSLFPLTLPGATRGELTYAELGLFVVNTEDQSLSLLSQSESGEIFLEETFEVGPDLTDPTLITSLFDGEDLLVADADSATLFHPGLDELEDEGSADLERLPARLFFLPESEAVYVGHAIGDGTTTILIEEDGPEVLEEEGPGGPGAVSFGYAERIELVTQTGGFD